MLLSNITVNYSFYIFSWFVSENLRPSDLEQKLPNLAPDAKGALVINHPPDLLLPTGTEQVLTLRRQTYDYHLNIAIKEVEEDILSDFARIGKI